MSQAVANQNGDVLLRYFLYVKKFNN